MAEQARHQDSGRSSRVFPWLAAIVAPLAMVSGFSHASASQPAEVVTEVVTEYRTGQPRSVEVGELASERKRLNRIKHYLNERRAKLDLRRDVLAARKIALDRRERELSAANSVPSTEPPARQIRTERQGATLCPSRC